MQQFRPGTLPAHAVAKARIIVAAAAQLVNPAPHTPRAIGVMCLQPLIKKVFDLRRQAQQDITCCFRAGRRRRVQHPFKLMVVDGRDDRREHHAGRNPRRRQL